MKFDPKKNLKDLNLVKKQLEEITKIYARLGEENPFKNMKPEEFDIEDFRLLSAYLKDAKSEADSLFGAMDRVKEEVDEISSRIIPELLAEQGLSAIKLADGSNVSVKKEFRCTLPKDEAKREQAYKWLRDQGLGDIIKNNIFVTFGKGEDDKAKQLLDLAAANGFEPQQKSDVAWATLTALFRERIESGLDMPSDVFSTWIKDKTKITRK